MRRLEEINLTKRQINALSKKNIHTVEDLVQYTPKAYRDYRTLQLVKEADPDRYGAFAGELVYCDKRLGKKWYLVMRIVQEDGTCVIVMMFSETFRFKEYASMMGQQVVVFGKPNHDEYGWSIKYPENMMLKTNFVPHLEPIYKKIEGISDQAFREAMHAAIDQAVDPLDTRLIKEKAIMPYQSALRSVHQPESAERLRAGKYRLRLNDMMYFAGAMQEIHRKNIEESSIVFHDKMYVEQIVKSLPYTLTEDQDNVLERFYEATKSGKRFNALIQGDVGCGKTVVAMLMIATACSNGYQAVMMAPREVLARQHYEEVKSYADKNGLNCVFLSSSLKQKEKKALLENIASGDANIIIGTHSCIADAVEYQNLGLIVTDEEHLFGVKQKEKLEEKAEQGVHSISMSATPIPRSLATILYGNYKEILTIRSMPKGRLPVKTAISSTHKQVFPFVEEQIRSGYQCYVVCPAIEENEKFELVNIETMEKEYRKYFEPKGIRIAVVHGKMDAEDIRENIELFSGHKADILISTTVIEVGVNVPTATVMVVEQAERFGLASLHQLRGRVGRSNIQSYCMLVSKERNNDRLQTMVETTDGFKIAEADLQQRGSGDFLGVRQAGNNRFVNDMIRYPVVYQKALDLIQYNEEHGYQNQLNEIYGEHAERVGEDEG